ncbi:hypothetical protein [Pseudomonas sp.]|uniref:hypothetical protein n=1 Tax=Pseudomonas sp. TaxID=306 RepID=UPI002732B6CB|nr:hypothetical protein [Pseudomonas sp.]MDP3814657.1 hypothetical protein [Pseudomonas sp.]
MLAVLIGSLALAGPAAADHGSDRHALIAGAVVGAVVGGVLASGRYPVYIEAAPPPVYYEPYPVYQPYPVVVEQRYYRPWHHKHHHRHHRRDRDYRRW